MTEQKTTLTISGGHHIESGEIIFMYEPDLRWWKRALHFILFMNPPRKRRLLRISNVDSDTTITVMNVGEL